MKEQITNTIVFTLYVSGRYELILDILQKYVLDGFCVSVKKVDYVYTMGFETGAEITLINYPRFPSDEETLFIKAEELIKLLIEETGMGSGTLVGPTQTIFYSRRKQDD